MRDIVVNLAAEVCSLTVNFATTPASLACSRPSRGKHWPDVGQCLAAFGQTWATSAKLGPKSSIFRRFRPNLGQIWATMAQLRRRLVLDLWIVVEFGTKSGQLFVTFWRPRPNTRFEPCLAIVWPNFGPNSFISAEIRPASAQSGWTFGFDFGKIWAKLGQLWPEFARFGPCSSKFDETGAGI